NRAIAPPGPVSEEGPAREIRARGRGDRHRLVAAELDALQLSADKKGQGSIVRSPHRIGCAFRTGQLGRSACIERPDPQTRFPVDASQIRDDLAVRRDCDRSNSGARANQDLPARWWIDLETQHA